MNSLKGWSYEREIDHRELNTGFQLIDPRTFMKPSRSGRANRYRLAATTAPSRPSDRAPERPDREKPSGLAATPLSPSRSSASPPVPPHESAGRRVSGQQTARKPLLLTFFIHPCLSRAGLGWPRMGGRQTSRPACEVVPELGSPSRVSDPIRTVAWPGAQPALEAEGQGWSHDERPLLRRL